LRTDNTWIKAFDTAGPVEERAEAVRAAKFRLEA
jgi:hypothetical protein